LRMKASQRDALWNRVKKGGALDASVHATTEDTGKKKKHTFASTGSMSFQKLSKLLKRLHRRKHYCTTVLPTTLGQRGFPPPLGRPLGGIHHISKNAKRAVGDGARSVPWKGARSDKKEPVWPYVSGGNAGKNRLRRALTGKVSTHGEKGTTSRSHFAEATNLTVRREEERLTTFLGRPNAARNPGDRKLKAKKSSDQQLLTSGRPSKC